METFLRLSDNLLALLGAKNEATGQYLNAATVQVTVVDASTGTDIGGQTWPTSLPYVAGSNGDYRATLGAALAVTEGQRLTAKLSFDAGAGLQRYVELPVLVQTDQG